jgi:4-hydroxybenzoate polyprenyltransferase
MIKNLKQRLDVYEKLMRLDKPIGILLLLWPTLWALWLSSIGSPNVWVTVIFALGVVLMRSAGCVINDIADRNFDRHVARTNDRPLAAGVISVGEALSVAGVLVFIAFLLVMQLNWLTIKLAAIALVLAVIYPFLKRVFWIPQAWLGVAFGFGIPMAFAAHQNQVVPLAWILLLANVFWAIAYDTEYAMVDRDDDIKLGLKSSAILFGRYDVAGVMICHAMFLLCLVYVGVKAQCGVGYFSGLVVAAGIAAYQYLLIRDRRREGCFSAFMLNNFVGAAVWAGILAEFWWRIPLFPAAPMAR